MENEKDVEITPFWSEEELNLFREHEKHGDLDRQAWFVFGTFIACIVIFAATVIANKVFHFC